MNRVDSNHLRCEDSLALIAERMLSLFSFNPSSGLHFATFIRWGHLPGYCRRPAIGALKTFNRENQSATTRS